MRSTNCRRNKRWNNAFSLIREYGQQSEITQGTEEKKEGYADSNLLIMETAIHFRRRR